MLQAIYDTVKQIQADQTPKLSAVRQRSFRNGVTVEGPCDANLPPEDSHPTKEQIGVTWVPMEVVDKKNQIIERLSARDAGLRKEMEELRCKLKAQQDGGLVVPMHVYKDKVKALEKENRDLAYRIRLKDEYIEKKNGTINELRKQIHRSTNPVDQSFMTAKAGPSKADSPPEIQGSNVYQPPTDSLTKELAEALMEYLNAGHKEARRQASIRAKRVLRRLEL
jgi:hypothetical protein